MWVVHQVLLLDRAIAKWLVEWGNFCHLACSWSHPIGEQLRRLPNHFGQGFWLSQRLFQQRERLSADDVSAPCARDF